MKRFRFTSILIFACFGALAARNVYDVSSWGNSSKSGSRAYTGVVPVNSGITVINNASTSSLGGENKKVHLLTEWSYSYILPYYVEDPTLEQKAIVGSTRIGDQLIGVGYVNSNFDWDTNYFSGEHQGNWYINTFNISTSILKDLVIGGNYQLGKSTSDSIYESGIYFYSFDLGLLYKKDTIIDNLSIVAGLQADDIFYKYRNTNEKGAFNLFSLGMSLRYNSVLLIDIDFNTQIDMYPYTENIIVDSKRFSGGLLILKTIELGFGFVSHQYGSKYLKDQNEYHYGIGITYDHLFFREIFSRKKRGGRDYDFMFSYNLSQLKTKGTVNYANQRITQSASVSFGF